MASLLCVLFVICSVFIVKTSAAMTGNSSFTRTSYLYYLDSGLPSTWYNNNPVIMDGWKMRVFLVIKHYSRSFGFYGGFYCTANSNDYLFSVVAVGEGSHDVVWSANMDNPVGENASLQLTRDKGLVLQDSDGNMVWSSNTSGKSVEGMNLTAAGNLVLFDKKGAIVWQSFDHPTDALLSGQSLPKGQKLVANYFSTLWRDGPFYATVTPTAKFSAFFNTSDGQSLIYYQLNPDKDSRNRSGLQYVEDEQKELLVRYGTSEATSQLEYIEYLKLDRDGHLRTYHYNTTKGSGTAGVDLVTQECPIDPDLVEVRNVSLSSISNSDILIEQGMTVDICKQACLRNCSCSVVVFLNQKDESSYGNCYMPSEILSTGEENQTTNGSKSATFVKVLNLNGSSNPLPPPPHALPSKPKKNLVAIISGSTAGGIVIILLILTSLMMLRKNGLQDGEDNIKQVPGMPMCFSFEVLKEATENFKETLGSGGFGSVFKGVLADGTRIAVKRLDKMSQGKREFLAEVETIGSLHHFNLVKLVGFCAEKSCRLLVYEYMTNGSLNNWIFIRDQAHSLDWQTRKKIILDIAKGLAYLHEDCRQKIVHLDIKPHNILLDEYFNAKISDFGLSTLIDRNESQVLTTLRGTPGYLAPEWQQLKVTVKVDVYSFGIVLLEIVSKRRNVDRSRSDSSFHLLQLLQKKAEEDQLIDIVEDLDEDMENNREEVVRMIRVGAWCLQNDYTRRPLMSTVVKVLEGVMEVDSNIVYMFSHAMASTSVENDHITVAPQASTLSAPR
ncbi:G-type lectin S-receptor-like serine/threonine-protein kinase SD2-5 [Ziziphus jujuba]|uniref:Receptor-like serine/threonine-protein kinase n=1 Tax=Ziziphus jujuba TaxID=326968 RepID=A0A6P4A089_ZIZJJ|nr:G-type lectin S-receptor-like serine/threonine-protein kinase SD2-5 [Ziziphus jujuba]